MSVEVSVIVAVNDHPALEEAFEALKRQTAPLDSFEVLVVDTAFAAAGIERICTKHANNLQLKHLTHRRGGRAAGNNGGIAEAQGRILVFLADDMVPVPEFVSAHAQFHRANPSPAAIGIGPAVFSNELLADPFLHWLDTSGRLFGASFGEELSSEFFYAANASLKRELIEQVGLFDEGFPTDAWDDYEFGVRLKQAGASAVLVPQALVYHDHEVDFAERFDALQRSGEAAVYFEQRYPGWHAWQAAAREPLWLWAARRRLRLIKSIITGRINDRHAYYETAMQEAFSIGYQAKRSQLFSNLTSAREGCE